MDYIDLTKKILKNYGEDGLAPLEIDKADPLFEYKKLLGDESIPLWRKAVLYKKLKWEIVRMNMDFRKEYNEWLNHTTRENLKSEYEKFCKNWQFPPANPDMPFPNTSIIVGEWGERNPLNLPYQEKYKEHIQIAAEDQGIDSFFNDECGHVARVNWASNDRWDYPVKEINKGLRGYQDPGEAVSINVTINLTYPIKEIVSIIEDVILKNYGKHIKYNELVDEWFKENEKLVEEMESQSPCDDEPYELTPEKAEELEEIERMLGMADQSQEEINNNQIDFKDHKAGPEWIDWLIVYKLKSRILKKTELEKDFPNRGDIFEWLLREGYFQEKEGVEAIPKRLTEKMTKALENQYPNENKRLIEILTDKYRKWEQIATQFYKKRDIDKDKIDQLQRERKSAIIMIKGGYKLIR